MSTTVADSNPADTATRMPDFVMGDDEIHPGIAARYTRGPLVKVVVEQKEYHIHKELLCHKSEYFQTCLTSKFQESQTSVVTLSEATVEDFEIFVTWLYDGKIHTSFKDEFEEGWVTEECIALYHLADQLISEEFANAVMDTLAAQHGEDFVPILGDLDLLPEHIHCLHPMRDFLIDQSAWVFVKNPQKFKKI